MLFSVPEAGNLLNKRFRERHKNTLQEAFEETLKKCRVSTVPLKGEEIGFIDRLVSVHALRRNIQRNYQEDIFPAFSVPLINQILSIDPKGRAENKLYRLLQKKLNPELFSIEYHKTMLPADVPLKYFLPGQQIKNMREELYRRIYFETKGEITPYYNHHYANFDAFLYGNKEWKEFTRSLLLTRQSRLHQYIQRGKLADAVEAYWRGNKRFDWPLLVMCSAELMLRAHELKFSRELLTESLL